jgi:TetR/AcrR family transcriptional repressor of nem operon
MKTEEKKRSRDPEKTRSQILKAASREIYDHGFQGVSIDQIIKKTNVTKGAFFHYFPTKSDLGYAIADEVLREMIQERWIRPLAAYKNPVQGILKRFKLLTDATAEEDLIRGCPLNNLTQEMSSVDPVFREKLKAVMTLWIDEIENYLKKSQENGYLKKTANTRQLAEFIVATVEGSFGMGKSMADRRIYNSMYISLRDYLLSKTEGKS